MYPAALEELIEELNKLPGIGRRTAEKFAFHFLHQPLAENQKLGQAISQLKEKIKICPYCFNFAEGKICPICADPQRERSLLCLVAYPQDIAAIESTKKYSGLYFVLGGLLDNLKGITPEKLNIAPLRQRLEKGVVKEIIFAFNPDIPGEQTIMHLKKIIQNYPQIKTTRLACGLPMGASLEYADQLTLTHALQRREPV